MQKDDKNYRDCCYQQRFMIICENNSNERQISWYEEGYEDKENAETLSEKIAKKWNMRDQGNQRTWDEVESKVHQEPSEYPTCKTIRCIIIAMIV